jgi:phosphoribosylformylglycinamidine (FGAM) synthase PurS component
MTKVYQVEIFSRPDLPNLKGETVKKDIEELGIKGIKKVKLVNLYQLEGDLELKEVKFLAERLLTDLVIENYRVNRKGESLFPDSDFSVKVWYKKGVTDAVGESAQKAAKDMGIEKVEKVKKGKEYFFWGKVSPQDIEFICQRLLANTIVEDYQIVKKKKRK